MDTRTLQILISSTMIQCMDKMSHDRPQMTDLVSHGRTDTGVIAASPHSPSVFFPADRQSTNLCPSKKTPWSLFELAPFLLLEGYASERKCSSSEVLNHCSENGYNRLFYGLTNRERLSKCVPVQLCAIHTARSCRQHVCHSS